MTYLQRLSALLPEYDPTLIMHALDLLRQGIPPDEVRHCLGLGPEYALMAREILRVSWFLVSHRMQRVETPEPLQVEHDGEAYTIKANGQRLQLSEADTLNLLAELYSRRGELVDSVASE